MLFPVGGKNTNFPTLSIPLFTIFFCVVWKPPEIYTLPTLAYLLVSSLFRLYLSRCLQNDVIFTKSCKRLGIKSPGNEAKIDRWIYLESTLHLIFMLIKCFKCVFQFFKLSVFISQLGKFVCSLILLLIWSYSKIFRQSIGHRRSRQKDAKSKRKQGTQCITLDYLCSG